MSRYRAEAVIIKATVRFCAQKQDSLVPKTICAINKQKAIVE